ncbi:hypothetical protein V6N13_083653 [Hibiscus sabdariffa]|uniref:NAB domain-containing protein n=1 Tax=Hibiscus sabdariffa TaxID=183260 RepID=A0ABR2SZH4_9ROSI
MLQRAASNAYSWWMASHIRTKQSKWMEQNLQEMEEKVSAVLKLIEEDGDSFIQKANMYYKKRPEIVNFVQEFFRAYRALADRYDHLSTELQNANNTIASICPDQVRGLEDDYDFDCSPRQPKMPSENTAKVPKVPKLPVKELKFIATTKKKVQDKKGPKSAAPPANKSGLTKEEGIGEINRIQKLILALQTEKEFVKSSYESRLAKYRQVENEIKEQQEKINTLQDEFGEGELIEDEEARNLMAATALKSCKETLEQLKQSQERSAIEAQTERKRSEASREKVDALRKLFLSILNESAAEVTRIAEERAKRRAANVHIITEKVKDNTETESGDVESDTEADVADKIDVLVNKVTSLETTNSSQLALIQKLKFEIDELQVLIQSLEESKANLTDGNQDLKMKLIHLELKWQGIEDLNHSVENLKNNMQTRFTDAQSNLDELSQNVQSAENLESLKTSPLLSKYETKVKAKKAKAGKEFLMPHMTSSWAEIKTEKGSETSQKHVATGSANASKELDSVPVSSKAKKAKAGKEFLKPKAGKEFLIPKMTSSSAEIETKKGSEMSQEHVATDSANASKELDSVPVSSTVKKAKAGKEFLKPKAGKEFFMPKMTSSSAELKTEEGSEMSQEHVATDSANASKEVNFVPVSANVDADASKELDSVPVSSNVDADASKELDSVPVSSKVNAKKAKAGKEFLKSKAGKDFLMPKMTSSSAEIETVKGSEMSQEHVATDSANASKELDSVPVSANVHADASKELDSVYVSSNVDADASKELDFVPVSANVDADALKELDSVHVSSNVDADTSKELDSVPVSSNVDADASKELDSVSASASVEADASGELNSVLKSANERAADASKELNSVPKSKNEGDNSYKVSETSDNLNAMTKIVGQASSLTANTVSKSDSKENELAALSQTLEETKKRLVEMETNHQNELFQITLQLKESMNLNAKKDEEIRSLRMKLIRGQTGIGKSNDESAEEELQVCHEKLPEPETKTTTEAPPEVEESIPFPKPVHEPEPISAIEEKFRTDIDELLEENLDFWFRFSSTLCEVQKYQTGVKDLEAEVLKLEERQRSEGSSTSKYQVKSDVKPLYTHLREIQNELNLWIEKAESLKEELKNRSASLCAIQEEITKALKASAEDEDFRFTSYQAAKFQGEILNMKQENNRVGDEIQAGLELAASLQRDAYRALTKLSDDWGVSGPRGQAGGNSEVRSNVPLRSFIFGVKQKKQKPSIFSVVQLQPALQQLQPALPRRSNKSGHSHSSSSSR